MSRSGIQNLSWAAWRRLPFRSSGSLTALLMLGIGLGSASPAEPSSSRLVNVQVVTAQISAYAPNVTLTGSIEARIVSNIAFRTGGKINARLVEVGQHIGPDTVLARLDPQDQKANVQNAEAAVSSAAALLQQAQVNFDRQKTLYAGGFATRPTFDQAQETLRTTQASLDSAKAALGTAREQLAYTDLVAGVSGIVTARDAEIGQVVDVGQTVFTLAQDGPRDAVFNIYETLLTHDAPSKRVEVALLTDPQVKTFGMVREISPLVDSASGTVRVKIGLDAPPPGMTLGASVSGAGAFDPKPVVRLPEGALFRWNDAPAVWVVEPGSDSVALKAVTVERYVQGAIIVSTGVSAGERIVTAGVQVLRPGQHVAVVAGETP